MKLAARGLEAVPGSEFLVPKSRTTINQEPGTRNTPPDRRPKAAA